MKSGYLSDDDYRYVYSRAPRLCLDLIIVDKDGLLLTKRDIEPEKGKWHTPGGRVFHNEKLADAASRIAQAELGITIELGELVGFVEFPFETDFVHSVSLAFFAKQTGGTLRNSEQSSEIKKWKELPPNMHKVQGEAYSRVWDRIEEQMR